MPSESQGPDREAGVECDGARVDWLLEGEHRAKDHGVRKEEGERPSHINVTVVLLELAEGVAERLESENG